MQDEQAIVKRVVWAGRRGSPYSVESSAEHKEVLALVDRFGSQGLISLADYGLALKALSEGSAICLESQLGKNVKYSERVKEVTVLSPETDRINQELRQLSEVLRGQLKERNKQALEEARRREEEEVERIVEERRERAKEKEEQQRRKDLKEQERLRQESLHLEQVRNRLGLWDSLIQDLEAPLKCESEMATPRLDDEDRQLISLWLTAEPHERSYHVARLLSARAAERVASTVYTQAGASVTDVSISQLAERNDGDWTKFDLLVDGMAIDVKNSRSSVSSPDNYTEHWVPKFKTDRADEGVLIAGFLSPYLKEWEFDGYFSKKKPVRFLGETSRSVVKALEERFSGEFFEVGFHHTERKGFFLPPWMFEYPTRFYGAVRLDLGESLYRKPWPKSEDFATLDVNPLPLLSIWLPPEDFVCDGMDSLLTRKVSRKLAEDVMNLGRSRPVIWMSLLTSILGLVASEEHEEGWSPWRLRRFVFFSHKERPLGCYDPLETVSNLLKALDTVWKYAKDQVAGFRSFKLDNGLILKGRRESIDKWRTIIAYCGGRVTLPDGSTPPCGKNPIYLGRERTCEECGKLICSECGFCMYDCTLLESNRQAAKERKRDRALVRGTGVLSYAEYLARLFSSQ